MKIKPNIIEILKTARVEENLLFIDDQLERKTYQEISKLLKALGGKWSSAKKATVFSNNIEDIIQQILVTGEYTDEKKEFQFFETPEPLAEFIVHRAGIQPEWVCLEPSAGRGNIARLLPNCDCIELNPSNRQYLEQHGFHLIHDDFMTFEPRKTYDAIVMNPPFCKQQDIKHVTKAIEIAKQVVAAIISVSPMWRTDKASVSFRNLVASYGGTIEELPEKSFKDVGTLVKTALVIVNKNN